MTLGSTVAQAAERIVEPVEGMHRAIARSWFGALGPVGRPAQWAHDAIAQIVYGSIRLGGAAAGIGLDAGIALEARTADAVQAVANGLWGDTPGWHESPEHTAMSVRDRRGNPVASGPGLATAFPSATSSIVVLVHGLFKTERCWHGTDSRPGMVQALEAHPDLTPVAIRYNTGLEVAANGERLASLLEELHANWPVPVQSISLVGHSMGGLVLRSACTAAHAAGHRWIDNLGDVVSIGSPHRGAPLEKLVSAVTWGLSATPQTRPLADFLNTRSQGIKDLRLGVGVVEDPQRSKPETRAVANSAAAPPHVRHHFVAGVITADPAHPFGAVVGDLMVRTTSSTTAPELDPTNVVVLGGVHHFDLVHDPAVIDRVMGWLSSAT